MKYRVPALLLLLLVTIVLYWPSLHGPFLFDDFPNLAALDSISQVSSWRDLGIYLSQPRSFPGRPLAMLSFLLQKSSWPDHPFPFRVVNLGIDLFNGLLVYMLVLRVARAWLLETVNPRPSTDSRAYLAATLASAAWLLNPIQLSGVALVIQRMTLLMATFTLLGLLAYLRGLMAERAGTRSRACWMVLGLGVCMGLSFLSKENGILLPLYALVLDATVLRDKVQRLPRGLLWLRRILIWPVVLFIFGYLLWIVPWTSSYHGTRDFTLGQRLLTEPRVLFEYLDKILLPRFGIYGLYHDSYAVSKSLLSPWTTLPALLALIGLITAACAGLRRWPLFALAVFWYFGGQILESSTVMLELYFEHRNYLPLVGIVMALAMVIARMPHSPRRNLALAAVGLWLVACCVTTALSARTYTSEDRLALTWANTQPNSIRAQTYLANRLYKHGQIRAALKVVDTIAQRFPHDSALAENRTFLKCMQGDLTDADMGRLDSLLKSAPFDRGGFDNMETLRILAFSGHCPALNPKSWLQLTSTMLDNPAYGRNGIAAGFLHYQRHYWAVSEGNLDMAIHELDVAYKDDPDANIPRLQAKYLVSAGLYNQAIAILHNTDYAHLPLLRRLLVNDRAINAGDIRKIQAMKQKSQDPGPASESSK